MMSEAGSGLQSRYLTPADICEPLSPTLLLTLSSPVGFGSHCTLVDYIVTPDTRMLVIPCLVRHLGPHI
jgi:hypothetical protein